MARLYLIRHAQSANNLIWDGSDFHAERDVDPEITDTGHTQAQAVAKHLADPQGEPRPARFFNSSLISGCDSLFCAYNVTANNTDRGIHCRGMRLTPGSPVRCF